MRTTLNVLCGLALSAIVVLPRVAYWGTVPADVHGDEGAHAVVGARVYAGTMPMLAISEDNMIAARVWIVGFARAVLPGDSIWEARLVTSLIGVLAAFAVVDIARRVSGWAGAFGAALVLALPLQISFERVMLENTWTTASWSLALWCAVAAPGSPLAGAAVGVLLALGIYAYQSARSLPLIVVPVLLVGLLAHRRATLRMALPAALAFAVVVWPAADRLAHTPGALFGHARTTSIGMTTWPAFSAHAQAIGWALVSNSPFAVRPLPLIGLPFGIAPLALLGLLACRARMLAVTLAAWIGTVTLGLIVRNQALYAAVLICMVPAVALAVAASTRWFSWLVPLALAVVIWPALQNYYAQGASISPSQMAAMAQGAFIHALPPGLPVMIAGGPGCIHGVTQMAAEGRRCETVAALSARPEGVVIVYPEYGAAITCAALGLEHQSAQWGVITVDLCAPAALQAAVTHALAVLAGDGIRS